MVTDNKDTTPYERKLNEPETLGDETGTLDGAVPIRAILTSEKARNPPCGKSEGDHDPFGEERVSNEPRLIPEKPASGQT